MVQNYRDLIVWQLGRELRLHVLTITRRPKPGVDSSFLWDIRRSARSTPANTAEGFARFRPSEFHHFLEIAKASLEETDNHLQEGVENGQFSQKEADAGYTLVRRITPAMLGLMSYLRSSEAEAHFRRLRAQADAKKASGRKAKATNQGTRRA
jgi:four helix bundle protein